MHLHRDTHNFIGQILVDNFSIIHIPVIRGIVSIRG
jgi:hypothetical protein